MSAAELGVVSETGKAGAVSLGKGAWDCDANKEIPPEKEVWRQRCRGLA